MKTDKELKEELKKMMNDSLHYINVDSPLKSYHIQKYQEAVKQFNLILAREAK